MKKKNRYCCDFETSTLEWFKRDGYARVWAFSISEIGNPDNFKFGTNIDDFMSWCMNTKANYTCYFHNLKFDGEYIFYWLLKNGYECIEDKKARKDKTFTCLLSDTGLFYSVEVYFTVRGKKINKVTFIDSLKILNFSVEKIAKDFKLPINKLELDYDRYRPVGYKLQQYEIDYIRNDVEIMARALDIMFNEHLDKMTIGSDALSYYKKTLMSFDNYYPNIGLKDELIRKSYRGGWTYLNPLYKDTTVGEGLVIDKNSMYPSMMYECYMPFGDPVYFEGKYEDDKTHPLYIQMFSCSFKVKDGKLPTVQLKHTLGYMDNEYIETTNGRIETLVLTNVDLELFFEHYDVEYLEYHDGFKFKRIKGLFKNYIDHWMGEKIKAGKEGNGAKRQIAKLMLNSLYGKFGLGSSVRGKYPLLEDDIIRYKCYDRRDRDTIYCPVASFITSYARADIIRNSQAIRDYTLKKYGIDYYIYSDTDSIHCLKLSEDELKQFMRIDDYELGAYKVESSFIRAKFIRQKCYIEIDKDNKINSTIAGMPKRLGKYVNLNNFVSGFSIKADDPNFTEKKLTYKHVKGGVILVPTDFTIKS
ncbi:MAG: hypothetical protein J6T10_30790 [Methanobrevibacter sp.]|nr:hypothetical protein [Methanobrevibacter sp.]